jgi:hypothetical protein
VFGFRVFAPNFDYKECIAMSGLHRLSREGARELPADQGSEFTFGVIALALLATLAIALAALVPDIAPMEQALLIL